MFRKEAPRIFPDNYKFDLFKADILRIGTDISIFCSGILVYESLKACEILKKFGINPEVINIHTCKPIDKKTILNSVKKTGIAITAENHNIHGGLFSAVSEVLSENFPVLLKNIGICDEFGQVGNINYLKEYYKMRAEDIANLALDMIKN
jgi:transketolase